MAGPVRLTGDQLLERALADRAEITARVQPTPRQVLGGWLENFGAGLGLGAVAYVVLANVSAPVDAVSASVTAGVVTWGAAMFVRGTADERARLRADRHVQQAVRAIQRAADVAVEGAQEEAAATVDRMAAQLRAAVAALDEADDEIQALRRGLDNMTRERDTAVHELSRERMAVQAGQRQTYVAPTAVAPQELRDATEMIRHRYQFGAHLSRRKAEESKRWSQTRWDAAQKVLADARVITVANGVTQYPQTLDEALRRLGEYMIHARQLSAPAVNRVVGFALYVESGEG